MLDFQRSVVDLCGGFVVIDNSGNVTTIHQTAREYLLSDKDRPFQIDKNDAHEQLFLNCMRCLMATNVRTKLKSSQKPEYLEYATVSWSSHLTSASLNGGQVGEILQKFLTGSWVLTWIHALATSKQVRALVQASKHLSMYSARSREFDAAREETGDDILRQARIDSWAEDLIKIVGKFGTILRRNPESIYKLIPPFCPPTSSIYQQFGKVKDKSLVVFGLSTETWDDSLARLSFGFGTYATSVVAAGAQIAVLISSGSVSFYDASTFEEATASPVRHGERIYRMEMNSTGTLLATYGYLTTKIWETSTGKCNLSVKNIESRPRPLAMLLSDNSTTLLVGMDDRRIRSLDLKQTSPAWQLVAELEEPELEGHFLNSSNHMALNKDGSLIAVSYRGHPLSAWETDGPEHIGHCWRKREEVSRGEVIEAVWHPHDPEVLGLYIEGVVFKWRPYEDKTDEIATGASRLALSTDGNLFATGDVRGTVKVYTTSDFGLLYQLASEDTVFGLAFSPDLRRFYDIRGHYGNAWEPNALMRYAEQRGKDSKSGGETASFARNSTASESWSARIDSITILACSPIGRLYCCGTENGTVRLYDTQRGRLADLYISKSFLSIEQMSWSNDGRFLCFCDSSKKIIILSIHHHASNSDPTVETKSEVPTKNNLEGPILQLLFHPDSSFLLVRSSATIGIISLASSSLMETLALPTAETRWIIHPHDSSLIVGLSPNAVKVLDWTLAELQSFRLESPHHHSESTNSGSPIGQDAVDRVLVTYDKKYILVQMSHSNHNSRDTTFLYFETSRCFTSTAAIDRREAAMSITPTVLPQNLSSQIALALSFLSGDKLIFLSRTFSICAWRVPFHSGPLRASKDDAEDGIKTLFSLPGDWISRDCLALCTIWGGEKSLLCPRNGEVAVVRCAALI